MKRLPRQEHARVGIDPRSESPRGLPRQFTPKQIDLTAYFDGARVVVKADLSDWKAMRRELRKR